MTDVFDAPATPIPRDGWGRPKVARPDTGKLAAYTRCTTYVGVLEDTYNLTRWKMRQVALGLADRPDLLLSTSAHRDSKDELNRITDAAMEAAQSSAAATTGTALHALTERYDRGQQIGTLPVSARCDLDAYVQATSGLKYAAIEQFRVHDGLRIGGTADRVIDFGDRYVIGDVKTGGIDFGIGKICMQLAVYAQSVPYFHVSQQRIPDDKPMDLTQGLIIHLPAGKNECTLHWVDLAAGWEAVQLAAAVRKWRTRKDLASPAHDLDARFTDSRPLTEQVGDFDDVVQLRAWYLDLELYGKTDAELLAACKRRAAELQAVS